MVALKLIFFKIFVITIIHFQWSVVCLENSGIQIKQQLDEHQTLDNISKWYEHSSIDQRENDDLKTFTNLFVVQIKQEENVPIIANDLGLHLIRKVFDDDDFYLFRHSDVAHRSKRNADVVIDRIAKDTRVQWVIQQHILERQPRSLKARTAYLRWQFVKVALQEQIRNSARNAEGIGSKSHAVTFNDPLYGDQWYLHNKGQTGAPPLNDINVLPVWRAGISGSGVRVSVLDDGVSRSSQEVMLNYDPSISYDFNELKTEDEESPVPENSHGTYCAAIVAGVANNRLCGVGVAYKAKVGGTKILNGKVTDVQEAMSLVHALDNVDIYTASWGPKDDGKHLAGPGPLTRIALHKGITKGREGKGAIYVWAAGNGGRYHDNCNMDGYASSIYTLTFGALTDAGRSTYYTEPCAAVIASTYVGGLHLPPTKKNFASYRKMIKVIVPEAGGKCRETFQGTSASAPMAAGVIALVLQANPELSWRDVQHLVVETARVPSTSETGWSVNGAGRHFHPKIGFGVLDAARMVFAAQNWTFVKPFYVWTFPEFTDIRFIQPGGITIISMEARAEKNSAVDVLEAVVATVNIKHPRCMDLAIFLISPHGTVSQILTNRLMDNMTMHIPMWEFVSLHFWGENPEGEWTLRIVDGGYSGLKEGYIDFFSLTIYGTKVEAQSQSTHMRRPIPNLNQRQLTSIMEDERAFLRSIDIESPR